MDNFSGKLAVITGASSGIGRQLAFGLAAAGCNLALCDVDMNSLEQTREQCSAGVSISTHRCDVSNESQVQAFASAVLQEHASDHINLLFNNAGLGGAGSFISDAREDWERTFNVCWQGVYFCSRAFVPLLIASEEGHIINVSSVNGFWACMNPYFPHTAYSAAKFAVKGFSEALLIDLRLNAPHVGLSVVMPGHIGTNIVINSQKLQGAAPPAAMSAEECDTVRQQWLKFSAEIGSLSDDDIRALIEARGEGFRDNAPTTAAEAAKIILDGVNKGEWRILVGKDAEGLDAMVRENPGQAYETDFFERLNASGIFDQTLL